MKIKLILCARKDDPLRKNDPFMPLSLAILAGAAPEHDYTMIDMLWEDDLRFDEPVDLVGISTRYSGESMAYHIADEFRKRGIPVILGGPQITSVPLRAKVHADAVCVGEGELVWPKILCDFKEKKLKDFYVSSPKTFIAEGYSVEQVFHYPDLQDFILPNRTLFKKRYEFDTVFAVRGCPMDCDFCSVSHLFGKEYRMKPIDHVLKEIDGFRNYFYLLDDTVFGRPSTYDYYLELYSKMTTLKRRRFWTGQINLDAASHPKGREVIKAAANAGLLYAAAGIESINPEILKSSGALGKMGVRPEDDTLTKMKENIRFIQQQGIVISGWFVIGYDGDTLETYNSSAEFCDEMHLLPVIFPVKALPGTRLYEKAKAQGRLDDSLPVNYINPVIDADRIPLILEKNIQKGYSVKTNWKRVRYYSRFFKKGSVGDFIHKVIFTLVLQKKLKPGIDASRKEFYNNDNKTI